ncbi:hypothetical protein DF047_07510 [Burkholderia cenocepacia]|nr:hypothetical protein DF047_07510 [Burkholderia cenocepacia]
MTHRFGATPPRTPHALHASRTTNAHDGTPDAHGTHLAAYISDTRRTQKSAVLRWSAPCPVACAPIKITFS